MEGWDIHGQEVTLTPAQAMAVREIEKGKPVAAAISELPEGKTTVIQTVNRRAADKSAS